MFTPAQVSEMLKIPSSSLRRYATDYADMLSSHAAQDGKKRRYTDEDLVTLKKIRGLAATHKTPDEIRQLLQVIEQQPPTTAQDETTDKTLALAYPELLEQLDHIKSMLANKDAQINDLTARLSALEERAQQIENDQKQPWYKRLFR